MHKPILFIPGFPASELRDRSTGQLVFPPSFSTLIDPQKKAEMIARLTTVPGDLIAGPPIRDVLGIAKQAQSLYDILGGKFGYDTSDLSDDFAAVGWDWRRSISDPLAMEAMVSAADRLSKGGARKLVAIVHSTGGLLFRAFLEAHPSLLSDFEQVLAFGVPWCGTLDALYAATEGVSEGFLFAKISAGEGAEVVSHSQAAYDLMPVDPSSGLFVANGAASTPLMDQSWIPPGADHDFMRRLASAAHGPFARRFDDLPVTNVCGWGMETLPSASVDGGVLRFDKAVRDAGDGTVPIVSSSWLHGAAVRTMMLPIGTYPTANIPYPHKRIWDSPPLLQLFEEVLHDAPRQPFLCVAADSDDAIDYSRDVDVRMSAVGADGSPLAGCKATVDIDGLKTVVDFHGATRMAFTLVRVGIHHNAGSDLYRFTVTFRWQGGGPVTRVVVIRAL